MVCHLAQELVICGQDPVRLKHSWFCCYVRGSLKSDMGCSCLGKLDNVKPTPQKNCWKTCKSPKINLPDSSMAPL